MLEPLGRRNGHRNCTFPAHPMQGVRGKKVAHAHRNALTGAQKFMVQKTIMIHKRALQKKHAQATEGLYRTLEGQERLLMFAEDRLLNPVVQPQAQQVSSPHNYLGGEKENHHQYLEVARTDISSIDDEYAEVKASQSSFHEQLTQLKQDLKPILCEFKDSSDQALQTLERILWPHVGRHPRPREAFGKQARAHLVKSKMLLADGIRRLNNAIFDFVAEEKEVKKTWAKEYILSLPRADADCQTDIPTGPTEEEKRLQAEVSMLKERIASMRTTNAKTERQLAWDRDRAKLNLQYLQEKFVDLHRELYTALHQVYKHRFRWIDRHTDPLRAFTNSDVSKRNHADVQFNLGLGEVFTVDTEQLKKFGDYFTRDDLFGMDMSAKDAPQLTEKVSVPWKAGGKRANNPSKRRSSAMGKFVSVPEMDKEREKDSNTLRPPTPPPKGAPSPQPLSEAESRDQSHAGTPKEGEERGEDIENLSKALKLALGDVNKSALSLPAMPTVGPMLPLQPSRQSPLRHTENAERCEEETHARRRQSVADSEASSASLRRVVIEERKENQLYGSLHSSSDEMKVSPRPPSTGTSPRAVGGRPPVLRAVASAPVVQHRQPRPAVKPPAKQSHPLTPAAITDDALTSILSYSRNKSGWSSPPRFVSRPG
eukprot:TRINITY_DN2500_c0_g1_i1.p1 TRINITY_DN2500_c0_g1~~TRINITY_DN2500_c0_g1_i1.p1  ORF type:complete len:654 (+),score=97.15 TRINITY_DN2500_c0_g1_i1:703-2664(+)